MCSKILALNIRHGGGARASTILGFLEKQDADVVILSEWRQNPNGRSMTEWAKLHGMYCATLNNGTTANGVFVASRSKFDWVSRTPASGTAGVLMLVEFTSWNILATYFPHGDAKAPFFNELFATARDLSGAPLAIIGDLNTGNQLSDKSPKGDRYSCADQFDALESDAGLVDLWRRTNGADAREWSWLSNAKNGFRIDHAFGNQRFIDLAQPVCGYDHSPRLDSLSDHSAILVFVRSGLLSHA